MNIRLASFAICRVGRVPSRVAIRGCVITCSRNNERLILSSYLQSLFSFLRQSRLIDLSFCCLFSPLWPHGSFDCEYLVHTYFFFLRLSFIIFPFFLFIFFFFYYYYFLCPLSRQHFVVDGEQWLIPRQGCIRCTLAVETEIRISVGQVRRGKRRSAKRGFESRRPSNILTASYK